jgi:nucleoside 2-deoxyribosyltransferase
MKSIYLAGPTVFRPDARAQGDHLKEACGLYGCQGLFPLDADQPLSSDGSKAARAIFATCVAMLRSADGVVADLSPFRGPHVDDGTAFEIGMAVERGLPVYGYTSVMMPIAETIAIVRGSDGRLTDMNGDRVEDLGQPFNAMIAGAVEELFSTPEQAIAFMAMRLGA